MTGHDTIESTPRVCVFVERDRTEMAYVLETNPVLFNGLNAVGLLFY